MSARVSQPLSLGKRGDKWESEKQMLDKFDWEEFESHCYSGRIVYRPDPHTPDVWQYKDTQDWSSDATVRRGKKVGAGQGDGAQC